MRRDEIPPSFTSFIIYTSLPSVSSPALIEEISRMARKASSKLESRSSTAKIVFAVGTLTVASVSIIGLDSGGTTETDDIRWVRRQRPFGLAKRSRSVRLLRRRQPKQSNATTRRISIRGIDADFGLEHADTFRCDLHPDLCADYTIINDKAYG